MIFAVMMSMMLMPAQMMAKDNNKNAKPKVEYKVDNKKDKEKKDDKFKNDKKDKNDKKFDNKKNDKNDKNFKDNKKPQPKPQPNKFYRYRQGLNQIPTHFAS